MRYSLYRASTIRLELERLKRHSRIPALSKVDEEKLIVDCCSIIEHGFSPKIFSKNKHRRKYINSVEHLPTRIVIQRIASVLRRQFGVKQSDRSTTIKRMTSLSREGVAHRVYKLDVSGFYESIDLSDLWSTIDANGADSRSSFLLRSFNDLCRDNDVQGAPRGLSISAVLSEIYMAEFDKYCRSLPQTYFYSRYVDDIVLVTSGIENKDALLDQLAKKLAIGLKTNPMKTKAIDVPEAVDPETPPCLEFLGYKFRLGTISKINKTFVRDVTLDISDSKVKRLKSRLAYISRRFIADGDFELLRDGIRTLIGNYNIYSVASRREVNVGLYCNYRLVDGKRSTALPELDRFLIAWIKGHCGPVSAAFASALSEDKRLFLLKYSFVGGFKNKPFYDLSPERLRKVREAWIYA